MIIVGNVRVFTVCELLRSGFRLIRCASGRNDMSIEEKYWVNLEEEVFAVSFHPIAACHTNSERFTINQVDSSVVAILCDYEDIADPAKIAVNIAYPGLFSK